MQLNIYKIHKYQIWKILFFISFILIFYLIEIYGMVWKLLIFDTGLIIYDLSQPKNKRVIWNSDLIWYYIPASCVFVFDGKITHVTDKWVWNDPKYFVIIAVVLIILKAFQIFLVTERYENKNGNIDIVLNWVSVLFLIFTIYLYKFNF